MSLRPPPNLADPGSRVWKDWFIRLQSILETAGVAWDLVDKTGSSLADIATRLHSSLQSISGNGEYHLSLAERNAVSNVAATKLLGRGSAGGAGIQEAITPSTGLSLSGTTLTATMLSPADGIGYTTGAGGTITQNTNKSTGVTLDKACGQITMNGAALAAGTIVSFTLTNNKIAATDVLVLNHVTTGTRGAYSLNAQCAAGSAVIYVRNNTGGSLSEAIVIRFAVIKGVTS